MTVRLAPLSERKTWRRLKAHHEKVGAVHLRKLFADDPKRGERMKVEAVGIFLDYSKNRITEETLMDLAQESGLRARIDAMFRGEKINVTEARAVLHVALRGPRGASIMVDGENVVPRVHAVLDKMADFAGRIRSGEWKGHTGKCIRNIVNIGIGGSDLGLVMAYEALKHFSDRGLTFRFELLVPAEKAQLERVGGDQKAWDLDTRPQLMVKAIKELQDARVEADVWKIEGRDRPEDCEKIVAAARRGGRQNVGCIVLGRGEDDKKVREWLTTAARVPGFIAFAVERTTFRVPLINWRANKLTREPWRRLPDASKSSSASSKAAN